ncbi:homoserine O-acetyltransferase, partial [Candidatus Micrarchaeota archaeon]|nr:homoserine O-acetyltransferase [Candidatus Micrarchaeota archaeon]
MGTYVDATAEQRAAGLENFTFDGVKLTTGEFFGPVTVAYKTYGKLSPKKDNLVFVCHSGSGDPHVSGFYPKSNLPGWWSSLIGSGRYINTDKFFVVCPNLFGGCYGSTGPSSKNPKTEKSYGSSFPKFQIKDIVACHQKLLGHLGVKKAKAVIGGSYGAMQTLQWMAAFPETLENAIPMAATASSPALSIACNSIGMKILIEDKEFNKGDYYEGTKPTLGLALARMSLELQFVSPEALQKEFGRERVDGEFKVADYLWKKSMKFANRADPNGFFNMLRSLNEYDLTEDGKKDLPEVFKKGEYKSLIISVRSDNLYLPKEVKKIVDALRENKKTVDHFEIDSDEGHDAFFTEVEQ